MIEILTEYRGTNPIILLDDVMSEFDDGRKQALLRMLIRTSQTFLTSTSLNDFPIEPSLNTAFFRINQGEVVDGG
jgi:DNA replication and repair protein RecF